MSRWADYETYVVGIDGNPHIKQCVIESIDDAGGVVVILNRKGHPRRERVNPEQIHAPGAGYRPTAERLSEALRQWEARQAASR